MLAEELERLVEELEWMGESQSHRRHCHQSQVWKKRDEGVRTKHVEVAWRKKTQQVEAVSKKQAEWLWVEPVTHQETEMITHRQVY